MRPSKEAAPRLEPSIDEVVDSTLTLLQMMHSVATPVLCQMDISMAQVKTMLTVSMEGEATVGAIARVMAIGMPAASMTVDRLVQLGWLQRSEDPADRRRTIVRLTDPGKEQVETVWRLRRDLLRAWLHRMAPDDIRLLAQGLEALRESAAQDRAVPVTALAEPQASAVSIQ